MDRTGRRTLLLISFWGMAACLATLSAFMLLPSELPRGVAVGGCRGWPWLAECEQAAPVAACAGASLASVRLQPSRLDTPPSCCAPCSPRAPAGGGLPGLCAGLHVVLCAGSWAHPIPVLARGPPSGDHGHSPGGGHFVGVVTLWGSLCGGGHFVGVVTVWAPLCGVGGVCPNLCCVSKGNRKSGTIQAAIDQRAAARAAGLLHQSELGLQPRGGRHLPSHAGHAGHRRCAAHAAHAVQCARYVLLGGRPDVDQLNVQLGRSSLASLVPAKRTACCPPARLPDPIHVPTLHCLSRAGSYLVYAVLNAAAAIFMAGHMVETKRQSVESIRALMMGSGGR